MAPDEGFDFRNLQIRWQNFRGLKDTGWIDLKPITLLIGPNNGGKTSVHAPLLLLKQTLLSRAGMSALLLRGEILNLGSFGELIYSHDVTRSMTFGIRWHSHRSESDLPPVGAFPPGEAEFEFGNGDGDREVQLLEYRVRDTHRRTLLRRRLQDDGSYDLWMAKPQTKAHKGSQPSKAERAAKTATRAAMKGAQPVDFLFTGREVRQAGFRAVLPHDSPSFPATIVDDRVRMYCQIADFTEYEMQGLADDLYYLGPLRESPRRIYELSGEMPADVGVRGEFAPEIVYRWRARSERIRELRGMLREFGVEPELEWKERGDEAFSVYFTGAGKKSRPTSFADLGFGMSQILPLIVQGLAAPASSWIVSEQPEIHLNPHFQAQLGDLFVTLIGRGVGMIVETHSEHLLLRLRRLVAEGKLSADQLAVLYVHPSEEGSEITPIPVSEAGHIDPQQWPKGFFGEAIRDSIGLVNAQLRND